MLILLFLTLTVSYIRLDRDQVKIPANYVPVYEYAKQRGFQKQESSDDNVEIFKNNYDVQLEINYSKRIATRNSIYKYQFGSSFTPLELSGERYLATSTLKKLFPATVTSSWYKNDTNRLVAHAGGGVMKDDKIYSYTNAKQAIVQNYNDGLRVFEIDFNLTADDKMAVVHDWDWAGYGSTAPTANQWMSNGYQNNGRSKEYMTVKFGRNINQKVKFSPMMLADILRFMEVNPDTYLVTDTKESHDETIVKKQFGIIGQEAARYHGVKDRIIPQLYNQSMYDWIESVSPFSNYIYTLYQSRDPFPAVLAFVHRHPKVSVVTMSADRASNETLKQFNDKKVAVYTHTVNSLTSMYPALEMGVTGFYTDNVHPAALAPVLKQIRTAVK